MLTEIKTPAGSRFAVAFPPDSGELAGQSYHLGFSFCDNPVCRCGAIHVGLLPEPLDLGADADRAERLAPSFEFDIDVQKRELDAEGSRQAGVGPRIGAAFVDALSAEDWTLLTRIFHAHKRRVTEETPDDEIKANFDADGIERDFTLVRFHEVLPYAELQFIEIEGRHFQLEELYCVKSDCACTDVLLVLLELVAPSEATDPVRDAPAIFFDYRTKSWRIDTPGEEDPRFLRRIAADLKTDTYASLFRRNHARLKALYRGYQARNPRRVLRIPARQSVGRNDPCPCGSGKKYKKCCLDAPGASSRA
ncbi:SEC-C metal-binding domain-containing protein [Thiocystis violacea]|uniref:SEC-C metal-binding domain-containing protein n=1 Tax=Thiocystis violacea TaxID=13725 RepID=UPI00190382D1|nr:SEC-C metal-binding domain-containing protein [Thiocystis violacea]MBK1724612.1 hypothetical protein [Thiocystis violacea]